MACVVVTGMAGISPIGDNWETVRERLQCMQNGIQRMDEWNQYERPQYPPWRRRCLISSCPITTGVRICVAWGASRNWRYAAPNAP